jgi:hypothetical protein
LQGGIIPVNLSTRLTRNLKTSHEVFIGSPALGRENKLWAKNQRNKVPVARITFLSQEMNYCHRNKVLGKRIKYLANKYIFFQRKKILVNIINLWRAVSVIHLLYKSNINKGVTANKNMFINNVQTLSITIYPLIRVTVSMLTNFVVRPAVLGEIIVRKLG